MIAILNWLFQLVTGAIIGLFIAIIIVEFLVGCGESYVDAEGVRHWYKCVVIPFNPEGDV
tara:strand:- start:5465 stop:5644 length:180 start_codon:yes stop_codon:yes gene_type:complete